MLIEQNSRIHAPFNISAHHDPRLPETSDFFLQG
jgi:hypothetical protein